MGSIRAWHGGIARRSWSRMKSGFITVFSGSYAGPSSAGSIPSRATGGPVRSPESRGPASGCEPAARSALEPGGIRALGLSLTATEPPLLIAGILPERGLTEVTSGSRRTHFRRNDQDLSQTGGKSPRNYAPRCLGLSSSATCQYPCAAIIRPRARLAWLNAWALPLFLCS